MAVDGSQESIVDMQRNRSSSFLYGGNAPYVEDQYEQYLADPAQVLGCQVLQCNVCTARPDTVALQDLWPPTPECLPARSTSAIAFQRR